MSRVTSEADYTPESEAQPNGKTIVLAEDDPFISRMYNIKLTAAGYNVLMAGNGRDAFELIKTNRPSLAMIDINLPELTGFEVVKALQGGDYDMAATVFMILTNSANPADRQTAVSMGMDYLIKADTTPRAVLEIINQKLA